MKVYFIGAGPGDPELMTLKGKRLLGEAGVVIYAGSLVNPQVLDWRKPEAEVYDSSSMDLGEICAVFKAHRDEPGCIARLHTGDPSLYGAIAEQIRFCGQKGIPCEVVPGVSSFSASAAALGLELTIPGVTQSVVLTRKSGRTPVPEKEALREFARTGCTLVLFLSVGMVDDVMAELKPYYGGDAPVAAVYRASWPDQKIVTATLDSIPSALRRESINRQTILIVGKALSPGDFRASKLYASDFEHGYRKSTEEP